MTKGTLTELAADPICLGGRHGGPQRRRTGGKRMRFDAAARRRFLDALSLTCNVSTAAAHIGTSDDYAYVVRRRDPVFAAQWREALECGLERLEAQLIEHGGAGLKLAPADPARALADGVEPPPFDFDKALRTLQHFAKAREGVKRRSRHPAPSAEDTDAAITKLLGKLRVRAASEPVLALPAPDAADAPGASNGTEDV